jgi:hypothetical protein
MTTHRTRGRRTRTTGKALLLGAALAVALTVSVAVANAGSTTHHARSNRIAKLRDLSLELVGQVQNSAPGVSPATAIQYGYLSDLLGLPIFAADPQSESTAQLTFYTDTTTTRVIVNGPLKVINRTGTLTIYADPAVNGTFADPNSFRDGTPVLVAAMRQQVIVDTLTGSFSAQNLNTIVTTDAFELAGGMLRLGEVGDRFRTEISGHLNVPPSAIGNMAGFAYSVGDLRRHVRHH